MIHRKARDGEPKGDRSSLLCTGRCEEVTYRVLMQFVVQIETLVNMKGFTANKYTKATDMDRVCARQSMGISS